MFVAWAPEAEVDAWLNGAPLSGEEKELYRCVLAEVRRRGFTVITHAEERQRLEEAIDQLRFETLSPEVRQTLTGFMVELARAGTVLSEIEPEHRYRLRMITAPIFDADGRVTAGLSLTGLPRIPGAQVRDHAYALSAAAARISIRTNSD